MDLFNAPYVLAVLSLYIGMDLFNTPLCTCYAVFKQVEELYSLDVDSLSELR